MINAEFYKTNGNFSGFRISGHAGYAKAGHDVVCAAVSSAVQLMVNLLDVLDFSPVVKVNDNIIKCTLDNPCEKASDMFQQLEMHFKSISDEFPKTIKITISEV